MYNQTAQGCGMESNGELYTHLEQMEDRVDHLLERTEQAIKELQSLTDQLAELETSGTKVEEMLVDRVRPELQNLKKKYASTDADLLNDPVVHRSFTLSRTGDDALDDLDETLNCTRRYMNAVELTDPSSSSPPDARQKLIKSWFDQDTDTMAFSFFASTKLNEAKDSLIQKSFLLCSTLLPDSVNCKVVTPELSAFTILQLIQDFVEKERAIDEFLHSIELRRQYSLDTALHAMELLRSVQGASQQREVQHLLKYAEDLSCFLEDPSWKDSVSKTFHCWEWDAVNERDRRKYQFRLLRLMQKIMRPSSDEQPQALLMLNGIGYLYQRLTKDPMGSCIPLEVFLEETHLIQTTWEEYQPEFKME